jgi:pimeloyl-ACP methyl ester carboxylesterase
MTNTISAPSPKFTNGCVVALHCSLSSARQWKSLADEFVDDRQFIAPNISGYGHDVCALDLPLTLAEEVSFLGDQLNEAVGPIHLVGHSYGGAIAFKIATDSPFAHRVCSLTLIEPVLPTLLRDSETLRTAGFTNVSRGSQVKFPMTCGMGPSWRRSTSSRSSGRARGHADNCRLARAFG